MVLAFSLVLASCSKNQNFDNVALISHGGMGLENQNSIYHDNSLESVEMAMAINACDGVEIDLQLSSDGNLWLYHDVNLESQTNKDGCIYNLNSDFLNNVRYRTFHKEKLVQLKNVVNKLNSKKRAFLDLRHFSVCSQVFVPIEKVISALNLSFPNSKNALVTITNYRPWIGPLKEAGFAVCLQIESISEFDELEKLPVTPDAYIIRNKDISDLEVQKIKNSEKKIYIFEVRSPKGIRSALKKNPDGIITDDIRAAIIEKY